jgi:hypothetical protein
MRPPITILVVLVLLTLSLWDVFSLVRHTPRHARRSALVNSPTLRLLAASAFGFAVLGATFGVMWIAQHGEEPCAPDCAFSEGSWLPVVFIGFPAAALAMLCLVAGGVCASFQLRRRRSGHPDARPAGRAPRGAWFARFAVEVEVTRRLRTVSA